MQRFAAVILVDPRGWILLQERDEHPVLAPEKWALCGGHLEPGEEPVLAAVRELAEETAVELDPGRLLLFRHQPVHHVETGSDDVISVYAAAVDLSDDDIVLGEGRQIVFVDPARARELDLADSARAIVPAFLDSELYQGLVVAS